MFYIKFNMKKILSIITSLSMIICILSANIQASFADEKKEMDELKSKYMILMDYDSGKILYEKNSKHKMYPASTTKMWTAFCAMKKAKSLDEIIEVKNMPEIEGSCMYLENGEKFTVRELLTSLLVHSSNDVAYLLAMHYGNGNPNNFIDFMNKEAKKYGAQNTHFNNPHGLPDTNHYSTALDMINLSRVAYSDHTIQNIVAMPSAKFPKSANIKIERNLINSNKFLNSSETMDYKGKTVPFKYSVVDGMKTGFTDDAGNCLVSTGQKNGVRIIAGVFFAPAGNLYHDSRYLLDYGFDNFTNHVIFKKDDIKGSKSLGFAKPSKVNYRLASDFTVSSEKGKTINKKDYSTKLEFDKLDLPIKNGDIIGKMNVYEKGVMVSSIGLVAESSSQSYGQYLLSKLPFVNNDKEKKEEKKNDDKETTREKLDKHGKNIKNNASDSLAGLLGIGDSLKGVFGINGLLTKFENTGFFKFLENQISSNFSGVSPRLIIYGIPLLILLIILLLIISIIKDKIKEIKNGKIKYEDDIYGLNDDENNKSGKIKSKKQKKAKKKSKILKSQSKPDKK